MKRKGYIGVFIIFFAGIAAGMWAWYARLDMERELQSVAQQLEETHSHAGGDILDRVKQHVFIPDDIELTVAIIMDIEELQDAHELYSMAKNGDYVIVTDRRAILYDPNKDIVLDMVPVVAGEDIPDPGLDVYDEDIQEEDPTHTE